MEAVCWALTWGAATSVLLSQIPIAASPHLTSQVQELPITGFVIGYPLELTGFQGKQGAQVNFFVRELLPSEQFPKISYIYWDERLTSLGVTNVIGSMDISGWRRKSVIDKMSALCVLQGCLDSLTQLENGTKCS